MDPTEDEENKLLRVCLFKPSACVLCKKDVKTCKVCKQCTKCSPVCFDEGKKEETICNIGDWFMLGVHHQLLLEQCLALRRKFRGEPRCFRKLSAGLDRDLREGLYHAKHFLKVNLVDENSSRDYDGEVDKWCSIASHFFENRNNYILLSSTGNDKTLIDKDGQWPPEPLEMDWFDFEKSFNILSKSECELYEACNDVGIEYPENEEAICLMQMESEKPAVCWKLLKKENRGKEGKEFWRNQAVMHLRDLMTHQQDLIFLQ